MRDSPANVKDDRDFCEASSAVGLKQLGEIGHRASHAYVILDLSIRSRRHPSRPSEIVMNQVPHIGPGLSPSEKPGPVLVVDNDPTAVERVVSIELLAGILRPTH